jgi:hypothetical protein
MKYFILLLISCFLLSVQPVIAQTLPNPDMAAEDLKEVYDLIATRGEVQLSNEQFLQFAEQRSKTVAYYPDEYLTKLMHLGRKQSPG